jgi:serine/threonine protein phosphatase PrpC
VESRGRTSISSVWLGAGGTAEAEVATLRPAGPGALVLRTDGLWNYLPDAADPAAVALPELALDAGGRDNVTVVVIPV